MKIKSAERPILEDEKAQEGQLEAKGWVCLFHFKIVTVTRDMVTSAG